MILFQVVLGNVNFICLATDREQAKRQARVWIEGDPDARILLSL